MQKDKYNKIIEYIIENQEKFYRLAFSYVRNKEDALDIVQNSICKALENYEMIRDINALKTWFYRVLVNESVSHLKKYRKEVLLDETDAENILYYEEAYEEKDDLYDEINQLSVDTQNIIKLRFLYRGLEALRQEVEVTV